MMRRQLKAHVTAGGGGLLPLAREAVESERTYEHRKLRARG
jgi:hypothetical protein